MKVALYALHYIHSTHDYGISFSSEDIAPMHSFIYFPPSTNVEAYKDAVPPKPINSSTLSAYKMPVGAPRLVAPLPTALSFHSLRSAVWTAVSSFAGGVLLVGLANARNVLPLVLVKRKLGPQMPHQRKSSTFVIFVKACPIPATFSLTYLNRLFSPTTMMLASDGHTIWLPRLHATLSFGKNQFGNGCKIKPSMFNTSLAKSIRLKFLLKRWGTAHISGVFGILSCHICPISSMIHFWQSITPISNLPNNLSYLLKKQCWQFIPLLISLSLHHLPSVAPSLLFHIFAVLVVSFSRIFMGMFHHILYSSGSTHHIGLVWLLKPSIMGTYAMYPYHKFQETRGLTMLFAL
jgi:hypothetical protein